MRTNKKLIFFIIFLFIVFIIYSTRVFDCCTISYIKANMNTLQKIISERYFFSVFCYMALYIIASACAMPGSSFFLIAGGVFFGLIPGLLYANIAATVGATILFIASRYFFKSFVQNKYPQQAMRFNRELAAQGYAYLLGVRLIAIFPFFLVNTLSGLTVLPLKTFIWTTSIGILPISFAYVLVGYQLSMSHSLDALFSTPFMVTFGLFGLLRILIVPYVYCIVRQRKKLIERLNF